MPATNNMLSFSTASIPNNHNGLYLVNCEQIYKVALENQRKLKLRNDNPSRNHDPNLQPQKTLSIWRPNGQPKPRVNMLQYTPAEHPHFGLPLNQSILFKGNPVLPEDISNRDDELGKFCKKAANRLVQIQDALLPKNKLKDKAVGIEFRKIVCELVDISTVSLMAIDFNRFMEEAEVNAANSVMAQINNVGAQVEDLGEQVNENINSLHTSLTIVNENLAEGNETINVVNANINGLHTSLTTVNENIVEGNETINVVNENINGLHTSLTTVNENVVEGNETINLVNENMGEVKKTLENIYRIIVLGVVVASIYYFSPSPSDLLDYFNKFTTPVSENFNNITAACMESILETNLTAVASYFQDFTATADIANYFNNLTSTKTTEAMMDGSTIEATTTTNETSLLGYARNTVSFLLEELRKVDIVE